MKKVEFCTNCKQYVRPICLDKKGYQVAEHSGLNWVVVGLITVVLFPIGICCIIYNLVANAGKSVVCERCHLPFDPNIDYSKKRDEYRNARAYEESKHSTRGEMEVKMDMYKEMRDNGHHKHHLDNDIRIIDVEESKKKSKKR